VSPYSFRALNQGLAGACTDGRGGGSLTWS